MNQTNANTEFEFLQEEQAEALALTFEELSLVAGGECVVNQL
jgi:hypothetical protein